ncbi:hypothetical protein [Streptomyces virginiae]|uniref:hypothetical protein n=1 Tax=Streptomyces virginiae TaxID=1961 RepID=UPI00368C5CF0
MTAAITAVRGRLVRRHTASMRQAVGARRWLRATEYAGLRGHGVCGSHGRPTPRPPGVGPELYEAHQGHFTVQVDFFAKRLRVRGDVETT